MARSKTDKQYWCCSILPIMAYTLNVGLRFGRGMDYNLYAISYKALVDGEMKFSDFEPIFGGLVFVFGKLLGLEWQFLVVFMSFTLIFSCVCFLRHYKETSMIALPLFVTYVGLAENTMRWFLAFSFVLIGFSYYLDKKCPMKQRRWFFVIFCVLGFLTHYGFIIVELVFVLLLLCKNAFPLRYSIVIFILCLLFASPMVLGRFADLITSLNILTGRYEHYATNAEVLLTGDGEEIYQGLPFTLRIYCLFMMILGYKVVTINKSLILPYNIALVGAFSAPLLLQLEIGLRINKVIYVFQFIILAYIFFYIFTNKIRVPFIVKILSVLILFNMVRSEIGTPMKTSDDHLLYIWDRHDQDYLDTGL